MPVSCHAAYLARGSLQTRIDSPPTVMLPCPAAFHCARSAQLTVVLLRIHQGREVRLLLLLEKDHASGG